MVEKQIIKHKEQGFFKSLMKGMGWMLGLIFGVILFVIIVLVILYVVIYIFLGLNPNLYL